MSADLVTDVELAEKFGIADLERFHRMRRKNRWPFVRFGRNEIRFTEAQVAAIIALRTVTPTSTPKPAAKGQTARSASRSRS